MLKKKHANDKDYEHSKKFQNKIEMKAMGDYYDLHLKTNIFLLMDVLEQFRKLCLENCKLDHLIIILAVLDYFGM